MTVSGYAPEKAIKVHDESESFVRAHRVLSPGATPLRTGDDIREFCWQLTGPLTGFRGYYNRLEGYAHSADALRGIATYVSTCGVKFILGPERGNVTELVYTPEGRCSGLETHDGSRYTFETVVCALGANGAQLVPGLGSFNVARCWSVAHVQLTPRECDVLRGIPVVNVRDLGFFFEPDPSTRLLKLTPLGVGFSNFRSAGVSLPDSEAVRDYVPLADEDKMRTLLRETLPWLADRPFVDKKMCWFSDTADSEYCIDFVPGTDRSLVVLSGDSGHGFKMMPIFGRWVCELLERKEQQRQRWQWRATGEKTDGGGAAADWGSRVSWRFGDAAEIADVAQEKQRQMEARAKL